MITSQHNIVWMAVAALLLFLLPLAVALFWKYRQSAKVSWQAILLGAAGFIVSARVLEVIPHAFCIILDNPVSQFINGHTWAYVLYGVTMAGLFEELGRYLIIGKVMKRNKTRENMVFYGIGHGGIEVWSVVLPVIMVYIAVSFSPDMQASAPEQILEGAATFGGEMAALMVYERIVAMMVHVALTIVVAYSLFSSKKIYLFLAIALHMIFDIAPALYQRGVCSMAVCEICITLCVIPAALFAISLYKKMKVEPEPECQMNPNNN